MSQPRDPRRVAILAFPGVQSLDVTGPLEDTSAPVASIAAACGFGAAETMRRAFLRSLAVAPAEYRRRFHPAVSAPDQTAAA